MPENKYYIDPPVGGELSGENISSALTMLRAQAVGCVTSQLMPDSVHEQLERQIGERASGLQIDIDQHMQRLGKSFDRLGLGNHILIQSVDKHKPLTAIELKPSEMEIDEFLYEHERQILNDKRIPLLPVVRLRTPFEILESTDFNLRGLYQQADLYTSALAWLVYEPNSRGGDRPASPIRMGVSTLMDLSVSPELDDYFRRLNKTQRKKSNHQLKQKITKKN